LLVLKQLNNSLERDQNSISTITSVKALIGFANLYSSKDNKPANEAKKRYQNVIAAANPAEIVLANLSKVRFEDAPRQDAPAVVRSLSRATKNKVIKFVKDYQASNAIRLLESISKGETPIDNFKEKPEVMEALKQLHPRRVPDRDNLPLPGTNHPAVVITKAELLTYLTKLPPNKAAALSGWTFELIKSFINASDATADEVVRLFNLMVNGKGGPASIWLASRLIPIKKGAGGIRPIAVADCWMRFLSGFLAQKFAPDAAREFAPHQFGVGVSGGIEIVVHAVKTAVKYIASEASQDDPHVVLAIDCKNAFNSIGRRAIYNKMAAIFPSLNKLIFWAYGSATPIYASDGTFLFFSETGVKQGDPLGPLLFAAGLQDILKSLHTRIPGVTVLAYLDDITIFGPPDQVAAAFEHLEHELALLGLVINPNKCQLFYNHAHTPILPAAFGRIQPSTTYIKILGTPMGSDADIQEDINLTMADYGKLLPYILQLPASTAYILLKSCINTKPIHLLRTVDPELTEESITTFDDLIDRCLHILLKKNEPFATLEIQFVEQIREYEALPIQSSLVRSLSINEGGLGIRKGSKINGAAWTASYLKSLRWIFNRIPSLLNLLPANLISNNSPTSTHLNILSPEYFPEPMTTIPQLKAFLEGGEEIPSQRMLTKAFVDPDIVQELTAYLGDHDLRPLLSMFKSYSHIHTGYWLDTAQFPEANLRMEDTDYVESLRLRLLMPIFPIIQGYHLRCPCSLEHIQDPIKDMHHCLTCPVEGGPRREIIARHNRIRDALAILLKKVYKFQDVRIEQKPTEPVLPGKLPRQSDVVVRSLGAQPSTHFDVAIVNPSADSYVRSQRTDTVDLAAAKYIEKRKIAHYVKSYGEAFRTQIRPFVLEATGAYGPLASAILKKMVEPRDQHERPDPGIVSARKHFLRQVSVVIATSNANMVYFARTHMHQDAPDNEEALPQQEEPRYPPNMLEDVWPPVRLEGEEDDRIPAQEQGQGEEIARARGLPLRGRELSQEVEGLLGDLGFRLDLENTATPEEYEEREEPSMRGDSRASSTRVVNGAAEVAR
jgi:hypothetical protein